MTMLQSDAGTSVCSYLTGKRKKFVTFFFVWDVEPLLEMYVYC